MTLVQQSSHRDAVASYIDKHYELLHERIDIRPVSLLTGQDYSVGSSIRCQRR
ncbi:MAG: hypothetical protein HFG45_04600 [Oscillospiraceae bacterium]|nr:hypothetical protein [Oscillospiraceae bacterium]